MNYSFRLNGLDCANCARKIEETLKKETDFSSVNVNFSTLELSFKSDKKVSVHDIQSIVSRVEPEVEVSLIGEEIKKKDYTIYRIIVGVLLAILAFVFKFPSYVKVILLSLAYIILLYRVFIVSMKMLFREHEINENFLILVSAIGAWIIDKPMEGLMVITLYEIGKLLEAKAISYTRNSITDLMNIKSDFANLVNGKDINVVRPEDLKIGDTILVKKGEKVPIDGVIKNGMSSFDTSMLTGESMPIVLKEDDKVLSGYINSGDVVYISVTHVYQDSTAKKILDLVMNATNNKAKTETYVSKIAKIYTPVVFLLAFLVFIFLPLVTSYSYQDSFYRALMFLVISCPCSIAISVPLSYFSGIGRASSSGILIKGSDYLDGLKDIKTIVFDKTGTLTKGEFKIEKVVAFKDKKEDEVLDLIYKGEYFSSHPIAKSIMNSLDYKLDVDDVKDYKEVTGKGISYKIGKEVVKIGNAKFCSALKEENADLYISIDDICIGGVIIRDQLKEGVKKASENLRRLGIKLMMFTGDKKDVAMNIAKEAKIDTYKYEMLPDDKYNELDKLLKNRKENEKVAFVGDGINDAPVLALSDIGISMGGVGSAAATQASDIVIMDDDIEKIGLAIKISTKTRRIIKQNLVFSIGVKILVLTLSLLGISTMWQAVFADVGTTILTILNTTRILRKK